MAAKRRTNAPPPRTQDQPTLHPYVATALLVVLGLVVYAPALGAGFIWDDARAITDNPAFRSAHPLSDIWSGRGDADYFPLKTTLLWLLYLVFGAQTSPYHVFNVVIHALNAVLLWQVLRRLSLPGAWLAGLVFLVHPTHVESVAWVSECKNTLSMLFGLLAFSAWLAWQRQRRGRHYLAALALFVAGLLCKTHLVILPAVLLLCSWWRNPQAATSARTSTVAGAPWWRSELWRLSPFFAVALAFGAITVRFQYDRAIAEYQLPVGELPSRVANAGKATWWYLGKAISPINPWYEMPDRPVETEPEALAVLAGTRGANPAPALPIGKLTAWPLVIIYPRWRVTPPVWYDFLPAIAMAALFVVAARHRRGRGRGVFVAFSYFLIALLPVLGLLKMSYMRAAWVADHFQYLANIGVIALGCAGGARLYLRVSQQRRRLVALAGATLVAGYAICTFARALDYRSEYTLWTDTVAKNPGAWQAQIRLGVALLGRNQVAKAAEHFAHGVRLKPDNADGRNNLGLALVALGRFDEGIEQYQESIRLNGAQFHAYANLADLFARQGRHTEAAGAYRDAILLNPRLAPLHFRLGVSLLESGQADEAIESLRRAEALAPNDPQITQALARAKTGQGR